MTHVIFSPHSDLTLAFCFFCRFFQCWMAKRGLTKTYGYVANISTSRQLIYEIERDLFSCEAQNLKFFFVVFFYAGWCGGCVWKAEWASSRLEVRSVQRWWQKCTGTPLSRDRWYRFFKLLIIHQVKAKEITTVMVFVHVYLIVISGDFYNYTSSFFV